MILTLKLVSIDYTGGIGGEWDFVVTAGEFSSNFGVNPLKKGKNTLNRTLIKSYFDAMNSPLKVTAFAREIDKYEDTGDGYNNVTIDPQILDQPQPFDFDITVKEYKGPNIKSTKTATLTLNFEAVLTDDANCKPVSSVVPKISALRNLPPQQFKPTEEGLTKILDGNYKIFGCVYSDGKDWKIHVTEATGVISWNVNCNQFKDVYLPGDSQSSSCSNAQEINSCALTKQVISDVQDYINFATLKINGQPFKGLSAGLYRSSSIPAAHENAHIADLKTVSPIAFKNIKAILEGISLGAVSNTSRAMAEMLKEQRMKEAGLKWGDDSLALANKNEKSFNQAGLAAATAFMNRVMAYKTQTKCK